MTFNLRKLKRKQLLEKVTLASEREPYKAGLSHKMYKLHFSLLTLAVQIYFRKYCAYTIAFGVK